jgi:hypothetical protein
MFGTDNVLFIIFIVYICLYCLIVYIKPSFMYDEKTDSFRQFGVGYKNTTILPLWLISIILAIISFFIVLYAFHLIFNSIFIKG